MVDYCLKLKGYIALSKGILFKLFLGYALIFLTFNNFISSSYAADFDLKDDNDQLSVVKQVGVLSPSTELSEERKLSTEKAKKEEKPLDKVKQHNPHCLVKLYVFLRDTYERSPVNLSIITGLSHLDIPCLKGGILGRYSHINREGFFATLIRASNMAHAHPSGVCHFWVGTENVFLVTKPTHIKQVLAFNDGNISRSSGLSENIAHVVGKSIFFDDGKLWQQKHRLWKQWLFGDVKSYASHMQVLVKQHLSPLVSSSGKPVNLQKFFTEFTLDVIGQTLMASDHLPQVADQLTALLVKGLKATTSPRAVAQHKLQKLYKRLCFRKTPTNFDQFSHDIREFFQRNVLDSKSKFKTTRCLLGAVYEMQAADAKKASTKIPYSDSFLADGIFLAFAGHITTAATFQFAVKLLAANPAVTVKLREALRHNLPKDSFTIEDLEKVDYLDWVIKETLRLYPPVPIISRGVTQSLYLTDVPVEASYSQYKSSATEYRRSSIYLAKNTSILVSPYITHRSETLFHNANKFVPERFSEEHGEKIPLYGYIPFAIGPRQCIGQRFALQELKLMLASIYYQFDVAIENNDMAVDPFDVTLSPRIKPMGRFIRVKE